MFYLVQLLVIKTHHTAQKIKFFIKDLFSKCDQIRSFLWIRLHLLKKSLMENLIFCAVSYAIIKIPTASFQTRHKIY